MKYLLIAGFVLGACILSFGLGRQFERTGGLPACPAPCAAWLRHELSQVPGTSVVVDKDGRVISSVEGHEEDILVLHSEE